jgi:hypothetical protein
MYLAAMCLLMLMYPTMLSAVKGDTTLSHSTSTTSGLTYSTTTPSLSEKAQIQMLIVEESLIHDYPPIRALAIARCESGYRADAKNANSSATGVFQFIRSTWLATPSGASGIPPTNWEANVKEAVTLLANGGESHWMADPASHNCWKGFY